MFVFSIEAYQIRIQYRRVFVPSSDFFTQRNASSIEQRDSEAPMTT